MTSTADLTEGIALQPFLALAKGARGKGLTAVIIQTLNAPNTLVFGELLALQSVQQLQGTEEQPALELLKIFAYGTYSDYKAVSTNLPPLSPQQVKKLRQLTLVSLSTHSKVISYEILQKQLEINEVRELEDLIIDAFYQGVILGKLDQRSKVLHVDGTMGRDVRPEQLSQVAAVLTQWSGQADYLLQSINEKINHATLIQDSERKRKEEQNKRVDQVKTQLKQMEMEMLQNAELNFHMGMGGMGGVSLQTLMAMGALDTDDRRKGGRKGLHQSGGRRGV